MTGGVNCGGGRRTRLTTVDVCSSGAPSPHIYRLEGRRGSQGGAPSRRNPTWGPPNSASPFPIPIRSRKGRGGRGNPIPFFPFLLQFGQPIWGGRTSPFVAGAFPLLAHKAHIFCRGCPEPLPVTRYVLDTLRNTFGVRILSSNISILTSRPFQDSSSCP